MRFTLFLFLVFSLMRSTAQDPVADSLRGVLKGRLADSSRLTTLNHLGRRLTAMAEYEAAMSVYKEAVALAKRTNDKSFIGGTMNNIGVLQYRQGDLPQAIESFSLGLQYSEAAGNKKYAGKSMNGLGLVYAEQGNYILAVDFNLKAMKLLEESGDKSTLADVIGNLGGVYLRQGELDKALERYRQMIAMKERMGDTNAVALNTSNIGIILATKGDMSGALDCFQKSYSLFERLQGKKGMGLALGNIGNVYMEQGKQCAKEKRGSACDTLLTKAIGYHRRALNIQEALDDKSGMSMSLCNLGTLYADLGDFAVAEKTLLLAVQMAEEIGHLENAETANENLYGLYRKMGQWQKALERYVKRTRLRDSIYNEANTRELVKLEMNYEFTKKEAATKLEQEKQAAVAASERKRQQVIIWSVCAVLLLVLAFAVFAYKSYLRKQRDNVAISMQKKIIEEKQKEILDSIHYAQRIQRALLPSEKYLDKTLRKRA